MFLDRSVPQISKNWNRFGFVGEMRHEMVVRIQEAIASGAFPAGTEPNAVFRVLLTSLHGAATLKLCDRLADPQNADALARITLDTALMGLRAGSGITNDLSFECPYADDSEERQS
jgi:hypothetical protein